MSRNSATREFITILLVVTLVSCGPLADSFALCGSELRKEVLSPQGDVKVQYWTRDCGATTGYTTVMLFRYANDDRGYVHNSKNFILAHGGISNSVKVAWEGGVLRLNTNGAKTFNSVDKIELGFFRRETFEIEYE